MKRLSALDVLRGLAALSVVLCHYLILLSNAPATRNIMACIWFPPLSLFATAIGAVMLFFVLSGYVLALSLLGDPDPSWMRFAAKRFCRIWFPYAAAILLSAAIGRSLLATVPVAPPGWQENTWHGGSLTIPAILDQIGMTSSTISLDVVAWSLVHELRISLIFPLLLAGVRRAPATTMAISVGFYLVGREGPLWLAHLVPSTATYLMYFAAGAWLAINQSRVRVLARTFTGFGKTILGAIGLLLLSIPASRPSAEPMTGLGAFLLLALVISRPTPLRILSAPWCQYLGRVSYSLYLTHVIVLMALGRLLGWWLPIPAILVIAAPAIALTASAGFYGIERPSIELGRAIARRFAREVPVEKNRRHQRLQGAVGRRDA